MWIQVTNLRTSAKAQRLLTTFWFLILVFVKIKSDPSSFLSTLMPLLFICPLVPSIFMSHFLLTPVASTQCCSLFQGKRPSAQSCVHPQHQHLWIKLAPSFPEAIKWVMIPALFCAWNLSSKMCACSHSYCGLICATGLTHPENTVSLQSCNTSASYILLAPSAAMTICALGRRV